jgi:hypothetical protein
MNGDNHSNETHLKDEVVELLKHEEVNALIKRFLVHTQKSNHAKVVINSIVILLGFLIGIGAFYLAYQSSTNETVIATRKAYEQERVVNIQEDIRRKIEWMQKIDAAVINMRKVRYHIVLKCENNLPMSAYQQALERFNARVIVVDSFSGSSYVFSDAIKEKSIELVAFDEGVKDVCAKNAPGDKEWEKYLLEVNQVMGKSIREDQEKLDSLGK